MAVNHETTNNNSNSSISLIRHYLINKSKLVSLISLVCLVSGGILLRYVAYLPSYMEMLSARSHLTMSSNKLVYETMTYPVVSSNESSELKKYNFLVYIVYHDERSRIIADSFVAKHSWSKSVQIRSSVFFESIFFHDVLPFNYYEWHDLDYVGMISYRAVDISINNMTFKAEDIPRIIEMSRNHKNLNINHDKLSTNNNTVSNTTIGSQNSYNYDVIPFLQARNWSLMNQAIEVHGHTFQLAWDNLLLSINITNQDIRKYDNIPPFFRNSFIAKPIHMKEYLSFVNEAMHQVLYNKTMTKLLQIDAQYDAIKVDIAQKIFKKDYYELYPFIFERLSNFWFYYKNLNIYEYNSISIKTKTKISQTKIISRNIKKWINNNILKLTKEKIHLRRKF